MIKQQCLQHYVFIIRIKVLYDHSAISFCLLISFIILEIHFKSNIEKENLLTL
jgi:hypothetical protein